MRNNFVAGLPPIAERSRNDLVTTALVATTRLSPSVAPAKIRAPSLDARLYLLVNRDSFVDEHCADFAQMNHEIQVPRARGHRV
jgi:hypothetical protein